MDVDFLILLVKLYIRLCIYIIKCYYFVLCICFIDFIFYCIVNEFIIIWRWWEIVLRIKIIVSFGINGIGGDVICFDVILY